MGRTTTVTVRRRALYKDVVITCMSWQRGVSGVGDCSEELLGDLIPLW